MSPYTEQRHHPRVPVEWPVLYSTPSFSAHGTVIDVSALAWRVEGSLPLQAGMQIAVQVWPKRSAYLEIQEARVLWARDLDFALEILEVSPAHELELTRLQEHTLGKKRTETSDQYNDHQSMSNASVGVRVLEHCHVRYQPDAVEEGLLQGLSTSGCQFLSSASLKVGSHLTVILYFNDGQPPMSVTGARVSWARARVFGVQFPQMTLHEQHRLQDILRNNGICLNPVSSIKDSEWASSEGIGNPILLTEVAPMKPRYKKRICLQGQVVFRDGAQAGEGRILDLTIPGCLVESAGIGVRKGQSLHLNISLHSANRPLIVTLGVVRWTNGTQFGVEFIKMDQANRLALNRFLSQQVS